MKENRKVALIVLIVCILVSVFGFGAMALDRERGKVLAIYEQGALHDGLSVKSDLTRRGDDGVKLAAIAAVYLGEDDADVAEMRGACEAINQTDDITERIRLSKVITSSEAKVYARLTDADPGETDARDARLLDRNLTSASDTIKNDVYFEKAAAFNKTRKGFPAVLIAKIGGVDELAARD